MPAFKSGRKRIIIDIDTQRHFFTNEGMVRVGNYQQTLSNIQRILHWAVQKNISIISTIQIYPDHYGNLYMTDSEGQKKVTSALCSSRTSFPANDHTDLPPQILAKHDQVIFCKRCFDPFEEPKIDRILSELQTDEFILIGAVTEGSIKATAHGLLSRQKNVTIVCDATGSYKKRAGEIVFRQMLIRGAKLMSTNELVAFQLTPDIQNCQLFSFSKLH